MDSGLRPPGAPTNLVENMGSGAGGATSQLGWANWAGLQQRMAGETTHLVHDMLEQLVSNQNAVNLKL